MTATEAIPAIKAALAAGWIQAIERGDMALIRTIWSEHLVHVVLTLEDSTALTGDEAVFKMRDEFLQLAKCYLSIYDYKGALAAIAMTQALEKFESDSIITGIVWPARSVIDDENHDYYLEGNEDTRVDS